MARDTKLSEEISSGDPRRARLAIRDYLVHELEGNRCANCNISKLRTGDTAALVLRLQKVLEELETMPDTNAEVSRLELIRGGRTAGAPAPSHIASTGMGSKSGPRQQGGRAASGTREPRP